MQHITALAAPVRTHRTFSTARLRASLLPCTAQPLESPGLQRLKNSTHLSHMCK